MTTNKNTITKTTINTEDATVTLKHTRRADGYLLDFDIQFRPLSPTTLPNAAPTVKVYEVEAEEKEEDEVPQPRTLEICTFQHTSQGIRPFFNEIAPELVYAMLPTNSPAMYLMAMYNNDSRTSITCYEIGEKCLVKILDWHTHCVLGDVDVIDPENRLAFYRLALTDADDHSNPVRVVSNGYVRGEMGGEVNTHIVRRLPSGKCTVRLYRANKPLYAFFDLVDGDTGDCANRAFIAMCQ